MQIDDRIYERRRSQRQQQPQGKLATEPLRCPFKSVVFRTCIFGLALALIKSWKLRGPNERLEQYKRSYSTYNSFNTICIQIEGTKKIQKAIAEVKKKKKERSTEHFGVKSWVMNEFNCVIHKFHIWHMD